MPSASSAIPKDMHFHQKMPRVAPLLSFRVNRHPVAIDSMAQSEQAHETIPLVPKHPAAPPAVHAEESVWPLSITHAIKPCTTLAFTNGFADHVPVPSFRSADMYTQLARSHLSSITNGGPTHLSLRPVLGLCTHQLPTPGYTHHPRGRKACLPHATTNVVRQYANMSADVCPRRTA